MAFVDERSLRERMLQVAKENGFTGGPAQMREAQRLTAFVLDGEIPEEEATPKAEPASAPDYGGPHG